MRVSDLFQDKRVRYGGYSVLMTILVVAILIVVNLVAAQLDLKWDLSADKLYSVSPETVEALNGLNADVTVYALFPSSSPNPMFREIIEQYPAHSGRVKLEYRDPNLHPTFVADYAGGQDVPEHSLIVVSGERFRVVSSADFVKYEYDYSTWSQYPVSIELEPLLTSAIRTVCDPDSPVVYRLTGHEEYALPDHITEQLAREGYEFRELNLMQEGEVPEDCDAVILTTPQWDITPAEAGELSRYLSLGGAAAVMLDMMSKDASNLEGLLGEYGLGLSESLIVEADGSMTISGVPYCVLPALREHPINDPLIEKKSRVLAMFCQGVEQLDAGRKATTVTPLLVTSAKAYGKLMSGSETLEKEPGDREGPFDIAVAVEDYTDYKRPARLFVSGVTTFLESSLNGSVGGANLDFFMNAMAWITQKSDGVYIRSKALSAERLQMNRAQQVMALAVCLVIIPLAILIFGAARWFRRKNK